MSESDPTFQFETRSLNWYEYIVFAIVLVASLGIGFFYGFFDRKNKTSEEFLMGGRSMSVIPVTLSIMCSFMSAISLLGTPLEAYFYGFQLIFLSYIPITLAMAFIYVPVYFELQLTSAYEYFEWRFSPIVRKLLSILAIAHLIIYMAITVWGPSLALQQIAGIDPYMSSAVIFIVCIIYSSLGGLKAVVWTDALQVTIILTSILSILCLGVYEVGGFGTVWNTAKSTGRTNVFNFDLDPRTRHTFWTSIIANCFIGLPMFGATQSQIQRYNSVRTLKQARQCLVYNMLGQIFIVGSSLFIGVIVYTKYDTCDPIGAKRVSSPDQLLALFVNEVLGKYPMIPGLFLASLTSGSLSSVSSALNALAAIIVEDFVKRFKPKLDEIRLAIAGKIISLVTGLVSFALVYLIADLNKSIPILPFTALMATMYATVLGAFTIGMLFPWANTIGAMSGIISSILLTYTLGIGNIMGGRLGMGINQKLSLTTAGCNSNVTEINFSSNNWKDESYSLATNVWNISYQWQPTVAMWTTIIVGLVVSGIVNLTDKSARRQVNRSLLSKPFMKLWRFCFGQGHLIKWVDYHSPPHLGKMK